MRKFTLFNFPKDRVYVLLEKTFRQKFFNEAVKVAGSQSALARKLKVSIPMVKNWWRGKNGIFEQAMPLRAIVQIYNIVDSQKFSVNKIQNAVIKYRARRGFSVIKPNLPLVEDERLIRIFFHMAGDGFAGHFGGAKPNYFNKNRMVMKEFIKDLSVFGKKIELNLKENGQRLEFPRVIGHILQYIYQTNFKSREVRMPSHFLKMKRNIILQGIKALMDDEGTVDFNRISLSLENKLFLLDIARLLQTKSPLKNHIWIKKSKTIPTLRIRSRGLEWYYQHIGFTHPRKMRDLEFYLNNKKKKILKIPQIYSEKPAGIKNLISV